MRSAIILLLLVVLIDSYASAISDQEAWLEYKRTFGKRYASAAEEQARRKIFIDNKHYVEHHNVAKSQLTFTTGFNRFSDLSTDEVNRILNGFKPPAELASDPREIQDILSTFNVTLAKSSNETSLVQDEPSNDWAIPWVRRRLDWREHGYVTKVKDQGSCGSCWAFASVGSLESLLAARGRRVLLSEQNLVDCSDNYGNAGCNGGLMDAALKYVRDYGIMSDVDYRYTGRKDKCRFDPKRSVMSIRSVSRMPRNNESLVRLALNLVGPLPIALDAGQKSFHTYRSGIYNDVKCGNAMRNMNHAVLLIGYGTDRTGHDYWIIKNSWGTTWGEKGYMRISKDNNLCGVLNYVVAPRR